MDNQNPENNIQTEVQNQESIKKDDENFKRIQLLEQRFQQATPKQQNYQQQQEEIQINYQNSFENKNQQYILQQQQKEQQIQKQNQVEQQQSHQQNLFNRTQQDLEQKKSPNKVNQYQEQQGQQNNQYNNYNPFQQNKENILQNNCSSNNFNKIMQANGQQKRKLLQNASTSRNNEKKVISKNINGYHSSSRKNSSDSLNGMQSLRCDEKWTEIEQTKNRKLTEYFKKQTVKQSSSIDPKHKLIKQQQLQNQNQQNCQNNNTSPKPQFISLNAPNSNTLNTENSNNLGKKFNQNSNNGIIFDNKVITPPEIKNLEKINTLEELLKQKDQQLQQKEQNLQQFKQKQEQEQKQYQEMMNQFQQYKYQVMTMTAKNKLQIEKQLRSERRQQILQQKARLGEIGQSRDGTKFQEVWKDGQEFIMLKERLNEINYEKEELEKQKKGLRPDKQQKNNTTNNNQSNNISKHIQLQPGIQSYMENNDSNSSFLMSNEEKKQQIEYQIQALKREEQQLLEKRKQLEHEKLLLIQKMKLDFEEQNCRFGQSDLPYDQQWPILSDRYQLLSLLGKGGFSEVYKAFDLEDLKQVACKIHQLNPNWTEISKINYIKHAIRETYIHTELNHPNIVRLFDSVEIDKYSFCTMLEFCEGPDLSQYLKQQKALPEKEAKGLIKQILSGLRYMHNHKQKVIHYDLKPQNIIFHKGQLKISDFGLCKVIEDEATRLELTSQGVGTYWYLPPETFEMGDKVEIGLKVDIWSLGVIFFEMIYGQRPFGQGMSQDKIQKEGIILKATNVNFPTKSPAQQQAVSKECQEFIRMCLQYNAQDRWDINQAYESAYIQKK